MWLGICNLTDWISPETVYLGNGLLFAIEATAEHFADSNLGSSMGGIKNIYKGLREMVQWLRTLELLQKI